MIGDLPPMRPCQSGKRGAHEMVVITREGEDMVMLACCVCGAVRRVSATSGVALDDYEAGDIADYMASTLLGTETR